MQATSLIKNPVHSQLNTSANKGWHQSSTLRSYMVKRREPLGPSKLCSLTSTCIPWRTHPHKYTGNKYIYIYTHVYTHTLLTKVTSSNIKLYYRTKLGLWRPSIEKGSNKTIDLKIYKEPYPEEHQLLTLAFPLTYFLTLGKSFLLSGASTFSSSKRKENDKDHSAV